jgi:hypothetical protein
MFEYLLKIITKFTIIHITGYTPNQLLTYEIMKTEIKTNNDINRVLNCD